MTSSDQGGTKVTGHGGAGLPPALLECLRTVRRRGLARAQAGRRGGPDGARDRATRRSNLHGAARHAARRRDRSARQRDLRGPRAKRPRSSRVGASAPARPARTCSSSSVARAWPRSCDRLDPDDVRSSGTRLLVDLLGQLGGEAEIPILARFLANARGRREPPGLGRGRARGDRRARRPSPRSSSCSADDSEMLRLYALDALRAASAAVPVERLAPLLDHAVTRKGAAALLGVSGCARGRRR